MQIQSADDVSRQIGFMANASSQFRVPIGTFGGFFLSARVPGAMLPSVALDNSLS
jgi:hypothetical protein